MESRNQSMAMAQQQQQTAQPVGLGGGGKTSAAAAAAATTATTTATTNSNNTTVVNQNQQQQQQGDTTYTKIFVGGLAWETKRETMKKYFEQFGEIQEAVVIMDKNTGRSKGYGFVTFRDREAAKRACADPSPVIDGRRANCNLASLGASRSRPSPPQHSNRFRPNAHFQGGSQAGVPAYNGGLAFPQPGPYPYQQGYPYSPFGFPAYPPDFNFAQGFYNPYAAPQFPQLYAGPAATMYPHAQVTQSGSGYPASPGYMQGPHIVQYSSPGLVATTTASSQYGGAASTQNPGQSSGMALTGASSVSVNRSPGQTPQQYAVPVALQQYAAVAASEQTAS